MAVLNVEGVTAVGFAVDTSITAPDGNTYTIGAGIWIGIPSNQGATMTVSPGGSAMCMLKGSYLKKGSGDFIQMMTIDEVRTST